MINLSVNKGLFKIGTFGMYPVSDITYEVDGDTIRFLNLGEKIIARPFDAFGYIDINEAQTEINELIETASGYAIQDIALVNKDIRAINYKTEIITSLLADRIIQAGLVTRVDWYEEKNNNVFDKLVLRVDVNYNLDMSEPIPAARAVIDRTTDRTWARKNGRTLDNRSKKTSHKVYSPEAIRQEGLRRRNNILTIASNNVGVALILTGEANDQQEAEEKIVQFLTTHSDLITVYKEGGKGGIYDATQSDVVNIWLETTVPDNPTTQAMIPEMVGLKIRNYIIEKLLR